MRTIPVLPLLALALTAPAALTQGPPPPPPPPPPPLAPPPAPPANPITPAKANLGKVLFWEEQLSSNRTVACGTCHIPVTGGSDPRTAPANPGSVNPGPDGLFGTPDDVRGSPGTSRTDADGRYLMDATYRLRPQVTGRKTPSALNAAYPPELFWDGRASATFRDPLTNAIVLNGGAALESQVLAPPVSDVEMAHAGRDWNDVAARIATSAPLRLSPSIPAQFATWINGRDYPGLFQEAFGTPDVTPARIAMAIATYERTLWTGQAPIDAFFGGNPAALTPQEQAGQAVFVGQGRCVVCHAGNRFTNDSFRYIGVRPQGEDLGRFDVTGNLGDRGRMKVPSLRNVELRGPYFHNGSMATLEDVIAFYNRGGDFAAPNKDPNILPLGLSPQQRADLAAFLRRPLTDPRVAQGLAPFDHPALSFGVVTPQLFGHGTAGSDGSVPRLVALEPPYVGSPRFTVALDGANPGRGAVLAFTEFGVQAGAPFYGMTSYLDMTQQLQVRRLGPLAGSGVGGGFGSGSIAIPNDPLLIGRPLYVQAFVLDASPGVRFAATEAAVMTRF